MRFLLSRRWVLFALVVAFLAWLAVQLGQWQFHRLEERRENNQVVSTNLLGSVNLARHVLPVMRTQGAGNVVMVGSVIGHIAVPDMAAYVVSKWGVRALVRQLQVDNRDCPGIRIEYVAPGGVDTPIYRQAATYGDAAGRPPFPVTSPDFLVENHAFTGNTLTNNGTDPDPALDGTSGDVVFLITPGGMGNCQSGNGFATDFAGLFSGLPACPMPVVLPGCPVPPLLP